MKTYLKYLYLIVCISLFTGCEGDLDIPQQGVIPIEGTYQNADDLEVLGFIATIYYRFHGDAIDGFMGGEGAPGSLSDLRFNLSQMAGEVGEKWQYMDGSEGSVYSRVWAYYYKIIYYCNMVIERLPGNTVASPAVVNQVLAEAHVMRAICMMNLVQLYGNPPLGDHILDGSEGNTSAAESWAFIEKDFSDYADALPSKGGLGGQEAIGGRLTKEAAYAYLGKAQLWQKKYSEAAATLHDKVIAANLYQLNTTFQDMNSYQADFCDEYMWEYDITAAQGQETTQAGYWDAVIYCLPLGNMYLPDDLVWSTGLAFGKAGGLSDSFGSFMDEHELTADGKKSNRYRGTLASYEDFLDPEIYTYSDGNKGLKSEVTNCEGYFRIKNQIRTENMMGSSMASRSHKNVAFMRYAEVLLNYAEAVAQGGTTKGMSGLEALNLVRRRAGLADAPALDMDNATYGVKAERRAELFYEGIRFIDLVRWGDAAAVLKDCGKSTYIFQGYQDGNNATMQGKSQWKILRPSTISEGFKAGKHELFPIPSIVLTYSSGIEQNPGW